MYKKGSKLEISDKANNIIIFLKNNNLQLMVLIYNLIFYSRTKYIDIQYYYICNKISSQKIHLSYILINEIINDSLTKTLIYITFYYFIE